jgi:hypothetical protein
VERLRQERAPGKQPDKKQAPEENERDGAIVDGVALAEITEKMLVDEVKPEEALRLARGGIAQRCENVPGSGDQEKNERAGEEAHAQQMTQVASEKQKKENYRSGKYQANKALCQDVERYGGGETPTGEKRGTLLLPADEEEIHPKADPEANEDIRNGDARKEIRSKRGSAYDCGPKSGLVREKSPTGEKQEQKQGENAQTLWEASLPITDSEETEAGRHGPIGERGFFEVADAVFVKSHPVVPEQHFSPCFGMRSVGVIKERRRENSGNVDEYPEKKDGRDGGPKAARRHKAHSGDIVGEKSPPVLDC